MKQVSKDVFEGFRELYKFLPLNFAIPVDGATKFYGCEIGDKVLIINIFNGDISTSSMVLDNHEIITAGDGKFIVAPRGIKVSNATEKLTKDISDEEFEKELDNFPKKTQTLEEAKLAAIAAADSDNSIQLKFNGNVDEQQDDGNEDDDDVSKYIDSLINGKTPKAAQQPPIITKGEKKAVPKPVVKPTPNPQPKPQQPAEEPKKFGGW